MSAGWEFYTPLPECEEELVASPKTPLRFFAVTLILVIACVCVWLA